MKGQPKTKFVAQRRFILYLVREENCNKRRPHWLQDADLGWGGFSIEQIFCRISKKRKVDMQGVYMCMHICCIFAVYICGMYMLHVCYVCLLHKCGGYVL